MSHRDRLIAKATHRKRKPLTFQAALDAGLERNRYWKGTEQWSLADWGNATAGECGEMCNAIKKLRRIQLGMQNESDHPLVEIAMAKKKIRQEVVDTITYALHVMAEVDGDIDEEYRNVFNAVSDRYGFPVKL